MVTLYFSLLYTALTIMCSLEAFDLSISINNAIGTEMVRGKEVPVVDVGKPFGLQITLEKADRDTQEIDLDGRNNIDVISKSQSMNMTHINGKVSSTTTLQLTVKAKQEGVFELGPAKVRHAGAVVQSNFVTVKAVRNPKPTTSTEQSSSKDSSSDVRCTLTADTHSAVVGQPILIHAKIYAQGQVVEMGLTPLQAPDFLVKEIVQPMSFQETINGKPWNVIEKKYIVTPLQAGEKKINPATATLAVPVQQKHARSGFFGEDIFNAMLNMHSVEQKQAKSNELILTIKPLPQHNKPVDAVGEFSLFHTSLSTHEATVSEPIVLTLTIEGKGNLDAIAIPKLILDPSFKYYESKNTTHQNLTTDFIPGKKVFEFIVQANKAGEFTIPAQQFTFYDSIMQTYKTLTTSSLPIIIKPSTHPQPTYQQNQDSEIKEPKKDEPEAPPAQDISFIQEEHGNTQKPELPPWLLILCFAVPCTFFLSRQIRIKFASLSIKSSRKNKKKTSSKHEKFLTVIIQKNNVEAIYPFFLKFFSEQNHVEISIITEDWIEEHLIKALWDVTKIREFLDYLSACAQSNFTRHHHDHKTYGTLLKKAHYWFLMLTQ